jgi:hypothetical protein
VNHGPGKISTVRTKVPHSRKRYALQTEVRENVKTGSEVFTDALAFYTGLDRGYVHKVIDHAVARTCEQNSKVYWWSFPETTLY